MQRVGLKTEPLQVALVSHGILGAWDGVQVSKIARGPLTCSGITRKIRAGHAVGVPYERPNWTCLLQRFIPEVEIPQIARSEVARLRDVLLMDGLHFRR